LKAKNQLPGWPQNENACLYCYAGANAAECDGRRDGDSSTYHYRLTRASKTGPWRLEKAWRADPSGRTVQKYHVP